MTSPAHYEGVQVTCPTPDRFLRDCHNVIAGVTVGTLIKPSGFGLNDTGWLVDWGDGRTVRCDLSELTIAEEEHLNQAPALPSVVLDIFFDEMETRHWSTSEEDVAAARVATLERMRCARG